MDMPHDTPPRRIFPKQIEATCFNRVRLALLRLENPLRIALAQHCGLEVILHDDNWRCVDSFADDQLILMWREFQFTHAIICTTPLPARYGSTIIVPGLSWGRRWMFIRIIHKHI